ncbi:MAG TPA: NAD-glutamate dehydrogenase [Thermoanaerobaculia bacterium]|nr:NAD-glutamate dehydrogenase [Thermoanaerobaculia bacterium]
MTAEIEKSEKIERVVHRVRERAGAAEGSGVGRFVRRLFGSVTADDVLTTEEDDLAGVALSLWHLAAERRPGQAEVRVFNPGSEHGWSTPHTVVQIVNDDMPFLVSSVTAALSRQNHDLHLVLHPVLPVRRDARGRRLEGVDDGHNAQRESLMHLEIDQETAPERLEELRRGLCDVLADVRRVVEDWSAMRQHVYEVLEDLDTAPPPVPEDELVETKEFLRWLADDHFTFLGYREYRLVSDGGDDYLRIVPGSGLGLLQVVRDESRERSETPLRDGVAEFLRRREILIVSKAHARSTVHRPVAMDYIAARCFDDDGKVVGERRFLGLFSSAAYHRSVRSVPLLRQKVERIVERVGFEARSHDARTLRHLLETFPRDELFQISDDDLYDVILGILRLQERQRVALFVRKDPFERFVSVLVYVPRDRHNTQLRLRLEEILAEAFRGTVTSFSTQVGDAPLARAHIIFQTRPGEIPPFDLRELEMRIAEEARTWEDRLRETLVKSLGEQAGLTRLRRYEEAFPGGYRDSASAAEALRDIESVERVLDTGLLDTRLYRPEGAASHEVRFKIFHPAPVRPLSELVPMLEDMGLQVVWEVPHEVRPRRTGTADGAEAAPTQSVWIRDFLLARGDRVAIDLERAQEHFREAFAHLWKDELESDGFNRLLVTAGLDWREVSVLRAYGRYLRQTAIAFSQEYMARTLGRSPRTARLLMDLFHARFDPELHRDPVATEARIHDVQEQLRESLQAVSNLDEDRILRRFLNLVRSTVRTNFFQRGADGEPKAYLSFKLDAREVMRLPEPRPRYEIWVYSPRVEAVHLRGGLVARGGIRWSDRRMDFRTEILGLLKAQMVKNAVIVPVGAKGGFVVKRSLEGLSREQVQAEAIECYRTMVCGLLDVTDNLAGERVVPPTDVVRHDGDDPYLVVAADKGTATFSDLANSISADYGFWLGDAFASGGSAGYDHKAMGITARGAWVCVQRHFRELGRDIQRESFTVVGVGDMSGDVFGNGMLQSEHTRLVAAFNHLHIFLDPDPDPALSYAERRRLFELPRSSWGDYDPAKLSPGGAVYERSAKSVELSPQARQLFGIEAGEITPDDLIRAVLTAPVDLLWLGGIGTYVKASAESQNDAGDHANDEVRVNGRQVRARVVGEGANLGFTQRGRIEYALAGGPQARGGRINTDAIDNSAGVDTSDHEVNIKILFGDVMAREGMDLAERDRLLTEMTEEVAALVLRDNYLQSQALSVSAVQGAVLVDQQERLMQSLERSGRLQRGLEYLPDDEELAERRARGVGLTRPELAVLLAYAKIALYEELLASPLPDDPELVIDLLRYFPQPLRDRFPDAIARHRLRREIVATHVTNSMVNRVGPTFVARMHEETGAAATLVARAYTVTREAFGLRRVWSGIEDLDNRVPAELQIAMILEVDRLVERATLWLLRSGEGAGPELDVARRTAELGEAASAVLAELENLLPGGELAGLTERMQAYQAQGVPGALSRFVASVDVLGAVLDIVSIAEGLGHGPVDVARVYFLLGSELKLDWLRTAAAGLVGEDPWHKAAAQSLIQDLIAHQGTITRNVLAFADGHDPRRATTAWAQARAARLEPVKRLLDELTHETPVDFARLAVANHQLRLLAGAG